MSSAFKKVNLAIRKRKEGKIDENYFRHLEFPSGFDDVIRMPFLLKIQSLFQGTAIIFLTQNVSLNKPDNKGREVFILKNFCFSIVASCSFISRQIGHENH